MFKRRRRERPRYDMGEINGRNKVLAVGFKEALTAIVDLLGRAGARTIGFGYSLPGEPIGRDAVPEGQPSDPPPGTPVVWWFEVTWPDGQRQTAQTQPRTDHHRAVIDAGLQLLRDGGANVTIVEEGE